MLAAYRDAGAVLLEDVVRDLFRHSEAGMTARPLSVTVPGDDVAMCMEKVTPL